MPQKEGTLPDTYINKVHIGGQIMARTANETTPRPEGQGTQTPTIRWDTTNLKSAYANVCNVTSTREEVVLNFGINQAWERGAQELKIELTNRLILSPFAAKRLATMLSKLIDEYENRYGKLDVEPAEKAGTRGNGGGSS